MGQRISWIACRGWRLERLVAETSFSLGETVETSLNTGIYVARSEDWSILACDGRAYFHLIDHAHAVEFSRDTEVLYFALNDTVMISGLLCLRGGEQQWSVSCDWSNSEKLPRVSGDAPAVVQQLIESAPSRYQVPALTGHALTGFRHDSPHELVLLHR